ncbi:MAG: DUF3467 domain-containing protein [Burkholderiales bacterium]|nr:DUF3467 domain-containing protein [Burkholderiales bacterium]
MAKAPETTEKEAAARAEPSGARVSWNTSHLKSSYCNVANATSTREEVVLNFGVNQNWDRGAGEFEVQLEHRIILSPFAAKRLSDLLARLIKEYETRYGQLNG